MTLRGIILYLWRFQWILLRLRGRSRRFLRILDMWRGLWLRTWFWFFVLSWRWKLNIMLIHSPHMSIKKLRGSNKIPNPNTNPNIPLHSTIKINNRNLQLLKRNQLLNNNSSSTNKSISLFTIVNLNKNLPIQRQLKCQYLIKFWIFSIPYCFCFYIYIYIYVRVAVFYLAKYVTV